MLSIIACCATRESIRTDVTINELVDVIEAAVGVDLERAYDRTKPQGVDGRNSDNTRILNELGWEPPTALRDGMEVTAE